MLSELLREALWSVPKDQKGGTSADTAVNTLPTVFGKVSWKKGTVNADIGGGPNSKATSALSKKGVTNVVFDPFNRSADHNKKAAERIKGGKADTATVANVLNVIRNSGARSKVIRQAANAVGSDGVAYFQVYEGDGSGKGKETPKGWQENRPVDSYVSEVKKHFKHVERKGDLIVASQTEQSDKKDDDKDEDDDKKGKKEESVELFEGSVEQRDGKWCVINEPTGNVVKTNKGPRCYDSKFVAEQVWYRLDHKYTGRHGDKIKHCPEADREVGAKAESLVDALSSALEEVSARGIEKIKNDAKEAGYEVSEKSGRVSIVKRHGGHGKVTRGIVAYEDGTAFDATVDLSVAKPIRSQKAIRKILRL